MVVIMGVTFLQMELAFFPKLRWNCSKLKSVTVWSQTFRFILQGWRSRGILISRILVSQMIHGSHQKNDLDRRNVKFQHRRARLKNWYVLLQILSKCVWLTENFFFFSLFVEDKCHYKDHRSQITGGQTRGCKLLIDSVNLWFSQWLQ